MSSSIAHQASNDRLQALTDVARARMAQCSPDLVGAYGGAEIDFMTSEERQERHALLLSLPTFAEEAQAAHARIQQRIAARKLRARDQ